MGVFTISGSPSNTLPDLRLKSICCHVRKTPVLAFRSDQEIAQKPKLTASSDPLPLSIETVDHRPRKRRNRKPRKAVNVATLDAVEVDYSEAAEALENLFKLSPTHVFDSEMESVSDNENCERRPENEETTKEESGGIVRSGRSGRKRLTLNRRVALKNEKTEAMFRSKPKSKGDRNVSVLLRRQSDSEDLVSIDWRNMKIPPVLPSSQHTLLFKTMQPMKTIMKSREELEKVLQREATDIEVASAMKTSVTEIRKHLQVGEASRSKLIKHNLRLVLFAVNKYYQELAIGSKFQDLCQAGAKGLIMAIDWFDPKHGSRLSTYGLFWIRHAILRSLTLSSFTKVSFGLESLRLEIRKAKLQLLFDLGRMPTEEDIIPKVGISSERYQDVVRASKPVLSLNAKHFTTQEELVKRVTDMEGVGLHRRRSAALLRLALDDVLDSLKPKESLVIRQRYGLDGNGDRTLGEVAGNLNISREMVRQHELKGIMKLKHPARVDYLRRYIS